VFLFHVLMLLKLLLMDLFDDTYSHCLPHVSDREPTKRRILLKSLNDHRSHWYYFDECSITLPQNCRVFLDNFAGSFINLSEQISKAT
jgi:hypothetical protein